MSSARRSPDAFIAHAERVRAANIAQGVDVLQATAGDGAGSGRP